MKLTVEQREHKKQVEIFQKAERELDRILRRNQPKSKATTKPVIKIITTARFAMCPICNKSMEIKGKRWVCPDRCKDREYYQRTKKPLTREQMIRNKWGGIRGRAIKKGVPFTITIEDIIEVCKNKICYYCQSPATPELDRKVPKLGYVRDNLVPSCGVCNTVKNNILTHEEMIQLSEITRSRPLGLRR